MLDELRGTAPRCDGVDCDRELPEEPTLVFRTDAGERRAYQCPCGAITMTVVDRRRW